MFTTKHTPFMLGFIFLLAVSTSAQEARPTPTPTFRSTQTTIPTPTPTPTPIPTPTLPATTTTTTNQTNVPSSAPASVAATTPPARSGNGGTTVYARTNRSDVITPAERTVRAQFERLLDGIRRADVNMVMGVYWNSSQLLIFNNNGTVTRAWEQIRANRTSSYPTLANVTLDVRDARVQMLSHSTALVTCLWTQSQTFRGTPETATGRLTMVFQLVGEAWRAVHTHTSPDAPDPSRILPSERTTAPTAQPTTSPTPPAAGRPR